MKVKEESEKVGLKLNIQRTKIMASGPITSWQTDGETVEAVARRSNQSILKEISPEYSLERLMLRLRYLDHLMQRADSLEKILMLEKIEGKKNKGVKEDEMVRQHH